MKRIALVIGNASYSHARPLKNTHADAAAIATTLAELGFVSPTPDAGTAAIQPFFDLSLGDMTRLLADFTRAARNAEMAIVYYSGHGIEIEFSNYLIPVEAELTDVIDVDYKTVALNRVVRAAAGATELRLIILDACRDNPFAYAMKGVDQGKSLASGLAQPKDTQGVMVFYAAEEGHKAREGANGVLSPFAKALVANLSERDASVLDVLGKVTGVVRDATKNEQRPRLYGELLSNRVLLNPTPPAAAPVRPDLPPLTPHATPSRPPAINPEPDGKSTGVIKDKDTGRIEPPALPSRWLRYLSLTLIAASGLIAAAFFIPPLLSPAPPGPKIVAPVPKPGTGYGVYLHTARPPADVTRLQTALKAAGFDVLGVDNGVDRPPGMSPLSGIDYATSTNATVNRAAAIAASAIVNDVLDAPVNPRPQSATPNGKLGVWLPYKPNFNVTVRFAGSYNRDSDIAPLMKKLRDAGWSAPGPQPAGGSDRTSDAEGLREVRYTAADDRPWAEALAADVVQAGLTGGPIKIVSQPGIAPGSLQLWVSPGAAPAPGTTISADQWTNGPPDQGFCFQRRDSPVSSSKYLVRCFQTNDLCQQQRSRDSGTLTACTLTTKLGQVPAWKDAGSGGILNSWYKYSGVALPVPPFPAFP